MVCNASCLNISTEKWHKRATLFFFCTVYELRSKSETRCSSSVWVMGPWIFCGIRCDFVMWTCTWEIAPSDRLWLTFAPLHRYPALDLGTQGHRGGAGLAKAKCLHAFCWGIWPIVKHGGSRLASGIHQQSALWRPPSASAPTQSEYLFKTRSWQYYMWAKG